MSAIFPFLVADPAKMEPFYFAKELLSLQRGDDGSLLIGWEAVRKLPERQKMNMALIMQSGGKPAMINAHCLQQTFAFGPKVLALKGLDFDVLEQIDINILNKDYNQPFKTVVVQLPEPYREKCETPDPLHGYTHLLTGDTHTKETHYPHSVIIVHEKELEAILVTVYLTSKDCFSTILADKDLTIEDQLIGKDHTMDKSLPVLDEEREIYIRVIRAALNACLYVDDYGIKNRGYKNPGYRDRLKRHLDLAHKSGDRNRIQDARMRYAAEAEFFELAQDVKFTKEASFGEGTSGQEPGGKKKTHWRRGHYRMQRHGHGLTLQKRIRIDPVLVNKDLFQGDSSKTKVVLHD